MRQTIREFKNTFERLEKEIQKVIIGQEDIIHKLLICMLSGGNVLMEGKPGLGKTELVKTLSKVLELPYARIQFTPDLMPVDILGTTLLQDDADGIALKFQKGPIFNALILADEINRATPKTQSALLEAMQEKTVTIGNETHELGEPFFVMATKNPLEMEGTYPLPEAQLDRFMMKLEVVLPSSQALSRILDMRTDNGKTLPVHTCIDGPTLVKMQEAVKTVPINEEVKQFAIDILLMTQPDQSPLPSVQAYVTHGISPRGLMSVILAAKTKALTQDRFHVTKEDILSVVKPCFRHRLLLNYRAKAKGIGSDDLIEEIIKEVRGHGIL